ncbi:hypothetical protein RSOLAG1IB_11899 [Rhizoctonia solani AG-1 IB]|uniref:Uncharacterized protein n=1 Tax=Thanatephorus cucumeris (strain AG1-IB / isolate 7/3/14) TaxID=1108050 RepID=A0A0B7FJB1_THACB|nr:hypothetical protein RSOLAG1IB_11899 [Rhizoctonia solani AG-1 IB]
MTHGSGGPPTLAIAVMGSACRNKKDTERVSRPVSQQDVVDVRSCSLKRRPRDLVSVGFLNPVRLCGLRRTTSS